MSIIGLLAGSTPTPTSVSPSQTEPSPEKYDSQSVAETSGAEASGDAGPQGGDTASGQRSAQGGASAFAVTIEPAGQTTKVEAALAEQALTEQALTERAQIADAVMMDAIGQVEQGVEVVDIDMAPVEADGSGFAEPAKAEAQAGAALSVAEARYTEMAGLLAQPPQG